MMPCCRVCLAGYRRFLSKDGQASRGIEAIALADYYRLPTSDERYKELVKATEVKEGDNSSWPVSRIFWGLLL